MDRLLIKSENQGLYSIYSLRNFVQLGSKVVITLERNQESGVLLLLYGRFPVEKNLTKVVIGVQQEGSYPTYLDNLFSKIYKFYKW